MTNKLEMLIMFRNDDAGAAFREQVSSFVAFFRYDMSNFTLSDLK
jgi:hypothetical protein